MKVSVPDVALPGREAPCYCRHRMPRRIFVKLRPFSERMRHGWAFQVLGPRIRDSRLWALNRRAITSAFGAGIAIAFIPVPGHLVLGLVTAVIWRLNVPTIVATVFLVNPLTAVPIYYLAYRVGALLLGHTPGKFDFELSWTWLQTGLGDIWQPFLLGSLVCAVVGGLAGKYLLELVWRISTLIRLSARRNGVRS